MHSSEYRFQCLNKVEPKSLIMLHSSKDPYTIPVEYSPAEQEAIDRDMHTAKRLLLPHTILIQGLQSIFQSVRYRKAPLMRAMLRLILRSSMAHESMSTHPMAREARFSLLCFGLQALRNCRLGWTIEKKIRQAIYAAAFSWFAVRPQYVFSNRSPVRAT